MLASGKRDPDSRREVFDGNRLRLGKPTSIATGATFVLVSKVGTVSPSDDSMALRTCWPRQYGQSRPSPIPQKLLGFGADTPHCFF
jgi:hypothetical protein